MPNWNIYTALKWVSLVKIGCESQLISLILSSAALPQNQSVKIGRNSNFDLQMLMFFSEIIRIFFPTHFSISSRILGVYSIKHYNTIFYLFSLVEYFTGVIITTILLCSMKLTLIPFVEIIWRLQLHSALLSNEYSLPFNNSLNSQMPWK